MLSRRGAEHQEEIDPTPRGKVGALPPQRPQLAAPEELCWRRRTNPGASAHLNRHQRAVRVTSQQIYLEAPEANVAREDDPAAGCK